MDSVLHSLLTFVLLYRYAAIFLITFLGAIALPIPSGSVLVMSFFFAAQGYLDYAWVAAVGFLGNIAGDLVAFWAARIYGERVLARIGLGWLLKTDGGALIERKLAAHPISTIFVSRLTTSVTPLVNVMVGLAEISFLTYIIVDAVGQFVEVVINFVLGAMFGDSWIYLAGDLGKISLIIIAVVVLLIVLFIGRKNGRKRRAKAAAAR
jgi:membrane protein DedA with SNARE-associated domain